MGPEDTKIKLLVSLVTIGAFSLPSGVQLDKRHQFSMYDIFLLTFISVFSKLLLLSKLRALILHFFNMPVASTLFQCYKWTSDLHQHTYRESARGRKRERKHPRSYAYLPSVLLYNPKYLPSITKRIWNSLVTSSWQFQTLCIQFYVFLLWEFPPFHSFHS